MRPFNSHRMPLVALAILGLSACGSSGKSGGNCAGTKSSGVTADFTGSVAASYPLQCATGEAYLSELGFTDMTSARVLEVLELGVVFSTDTSCTFTNGSVLDLSTTTCVRVTGGAQVGQTKAAFSNAPGYPAGTGTLTMTQWSAAKGGTVEGDFSNVVFPTIEPTDGGVNGQVVLNGSYSLVLP